MGKRSLVVMMFLALGISTLLYGDIIRLKNGNKLQGQIIHDDGKFLRVKVPSGVIYVKKKDIASIESQKQEDYWVDESRRLRRLRAYDDAIRHLKEFLKKNPNSGKAKIALKKSYIKASQKALSSRQISQSKKLIEEALQLFPQDGEAVKLKQTIDQYQQMVDKLSSNAIGLHKSGDFQQALSVYKKILHYMPEKIKQLSQPIAHAYIKMGRKLFGQKQYDQASAHYEKAMEFDPVFSRQAEPYLIQCALYRANNQFRTGNMPQAEKIIRKAIHFSPDNIRLYFFLAYSLQGQGKVGKAVSIYCQILKRPVPTGGQVDVAALQQAAAKASKLTLMSGEQVNQYARHVEKGDWKKIETTHYTIYHKNQYLAKRVASSAEYHHQLIKNRLIRGYSLKWTKKCQIYIYPTKAEYLQRSRMPGTGGVTIVQAYGGILRSHKILTYQRANQLIKSVIPHEVGHVLLRYSHKYGGTLPLWYNEGMAVSMEYAYHRNFYKWKVKGTMAQKQNFPLKILMKVRSYPRNLPNNQMFYAQSYSAVEFFHSLGGWSKLHRMGTLLSQGQKPEQVIRQLFGFSNLDEAQKAWDKHILKTY